MSSDANKKLVRRMFEEAWNQGNLDVVDELLAANATDHHDPDVPSFPEHLKAQIVANRRAFPDLRFTIEELIAEGDIVACRLTLSGTHRGVFNGVPPTERRFTQEHMHMVRVAGGKGRDHWAVFGTFGMLQQLGVLPAAPAKERP